MLLWLDGTLLSYKALFLLGILSVLGGRSFGMRKSSYFVLPLLVASVSSAVVAYHLLRSPRVESETGPLAEMLITAVFFIGTGILTSAGIAVGFILRWLWNSLVRTTRLSGPQNAEE